MDVGRLIAAARRAGKLAKAELSRRSGVDVGHIARLERGRVTDPRLSMLAALARGLGLELVVEFRPTKGKAKGNRSRVDGQ
jgi:transcriptional regulator with XRE-family HTH domain